MSSRYLSAAIGTLLLTIAPAHAAPSRTDFVLLEKEALLVLPPKIVTSGIVEKAEWSSDGRYVLALRTELQFSSPLRLDRPPSMEEAIVLWNSATGKSKELWSGTNSGEGQHRDFAWLAKTDVAMALLNVQRPVPPAERKPGVPPTRLEKWLFRMDAGRSQLRGLARVGMNTTLHAAPDAPGALLWTKDEGEALLRWVRADGTVSPVNLPKDLKDPQYLGPYLWLPDGRRASIGVVNIAAGPNAISGQKLIIVDVVSGAVSLVDGPQKSYQVPTTAGLQVRLQHGSMQFGDAKSPTEVKPLWLESSVPTEQPRALIAADAEWGRLSPNGENVLYTDDRGAWVVKPLRVSKEVFIAARLAALRSVALSNGKQAATGLMMYAQDNDERFPSAGEPIVDLLMPYIKNEKVFEGFVYTYPGGSLAEIESPSETIVGHVLAPGGKAIVFADGHVKWEADPK